MNCCKKEAIEIIKEYDPTPKNPDGSIRWFLFRWDDGKNGVRRLVRCRVCGTLYLVQAYHLHKFSGQKDTLFEDYYAVRDEKQADYFNRTYTGMQLEHTRTPDFQIAAK
ncbi:MAG: hypothetical protein J6C52_11725 [Clostridia bacterium]|nr:hypothetical protein [Clostridia bacterium]